MEDGYGAEQMSTRTQTTLKIALWLVPIIFASGSLYYQQHQTAAQASSNETHIQDHEKLDAHPVVEERVERLEEDTREMIMEQRVIRTEQSRAAENISSICQATGARCR